MPSFSRRFRTGFKYLKKKVISVFRPKPTRDTEAIESEPISLISNHPSSSTKNPTASENRHRVILKNNLPYDLSFKVLDPAEDVVSFELKAGGDIHLSLDCNQTLVGYLVYLGLKWTFAEKFQSLASLQMAEFVAEGDRYMNLGWHKNDDGEFTIFSPMLLINQSEAPLSFLVQGPNIYRGMKIYNEKSSEPLLLNFDVVQLYVSLHPDDSCIEEKWSNVPLDTNAIVECFNHERDDAFFIRSTASCQNSDGLGTTLTFTSCSSDSDAGIEEDGDVTRHTQHDDDLTWNFRNDLPYDVVVEVEQNRIKVSAGQQATLTNKLDSLLLIHLFYLDIPWVFEELFYSLSHLETLEFRASEGYETLYLQYQLQIDDDSNITLSMFTPYWVENQTGLDIAYLQQNGPGPIKTFSKSYHIPDKISQPLLLNCDISQLSLAVANRQGGREKWNEIRLDRSGCTELITTDSIPHQVRYDFQVTYSSITVITLREIKPEDLNSGRCGPCVNSKTLASMSGGFFYELPFEQLHLSLRIQDNEEIYVEWESIGEKEGCFWTTLISTRAIFIVTLSFNNEKWEFQSEIQSLCQLEECEFVSEAGQKMRLRFSHDFEDNGVINFYLEDLITLVS